MVVNSNGTEPGVMGKYGLSRAVIRQRKEGYDVAAEGFGIQRGIKHFRLRRTADKYAYQLARKYDILYQYIPRR